MSEDLISSAIEDFFSKGYKAVREDDTLSKCLSLFEEEMPPVLVVLDQKGRYQGVIARRWIVRSRLDPSEAKVKKLMRPTPRVQLHDSLSEVARLMIESQVRQLPVCRGEKLMGFVTDEDVIHGAVIQGWGETEVKEIMTKRPFMVEEDESAGSVLSLFRDQDISHAPVVSEGELVGIVSVHDFVEHIFQPRKRRTVGETVGEKVPVLSIPAKGIMTKPVITAAPGEELRRVAEKMHKFDVSSIVVVKNRRPVGIVTKRDFLEPIAQMRRERPVLTIQFSVKDLEIDEVQRNFLIDDFESFAKRYQETLKGGTLFVYLKTHGTNYKGDPLIHCRLQLRTLKGSFFSSSEGFGVEKTFSRALDRLDRKILRSKELEYEPEFARKYLRRIQFPLAHL
ncbi:CBS domain-containing protein [Candidatus Bathyarchaeota archaeon]|nr:CBS domain-containing protein [Candidatus Bathyarchaeota archaeon]NIU80793.1 CBS domain-containing protein [Candidatus Bathyarchaeota archaeon]NIV67418.1 CBS domain-containing protein [Candidatus Bathyarchaeota archaeon]NIW15962.1 CBS domain-containing protein [Candidatus Bathyarchaeota archaeon]NIW34064.1 CBS domain-containing protein [Candidatus Bathyarchaeota archaeon]